MRRRQRFTVTQVTGEKHVILAYVPSEAREYYESRGYIVASIARGDYRKSKRPPSGARPRLSGIAAAGEFLGLTLPVEVKVTGHQGGASGRHRAQITLAGGWQHRITVKNWLSSDEMGRVLWHELAHAMQFERDALARRLDYKATIRTWNAAYHDGTAYSRKPYEIEARSYEEYNDEIRLAL